MYLQYKIFTYCHYTSYRRSDCDKIFIRSCCAMYLLPSWALMHVPIAYLSRTKTLQMCLDQIKVLNSTPEITAGSRLTAKVHCIALNMCNHNKPLSYWVITVTCRVYDVSDNGWLGEFFANIDLCLLDR